VTITDKYAAELLGFILGQFKRGKRSGQEFPC
jgi:hypothetical protein